MAEIGFPIPDALLRDDGRIQLTEEQVAHVLEVLDHPPPDSLAAIRKLLSDRSVLDG